MMVTAKPSAPARPVRPTLCVYAVMSAGTSTFTTVRTPLKSTPLVTPNSAVSLLPLCRVACAAADASLATRTSKAPALNCSIVLWRDARGRVATRVPARVPNASNSNRTRYAVSGEFAKRRTFFFPSSSQRSRAFLLSAPTVSTSSSWTYRVQCAANPSRRPRP